jgi:hypothetical protein
LSGPPPVSRTPFEFGFVRLVERQGSSSVRARVQDRGRTVGSGAMCIGLSSASELGKLCDFAQSGARTRHQPRHPFLRCWRLRLLACSSFASHCLTQDGLCFGISEVWFRPFPLAPRPLDIDADCRVRRYELGIPGRSLSRPWQPQRSARASHLSPHRAHRLAADPELLFRRSLAPRRPRHPRAGSTPRTARNVWAQVLTTDQGVE